MKPILEELFYGHIRPLNQKISGIKKTLQEKLPAEDYQALEEMLELYCDSGVLESAASFGYGFKLGALMMLEALGNKDEVVMIYEQG
jgi:hypothetical protein